MASAESLLHNFSSMLEYIPFIVLPAGSTVTHVAATRPFTLLAILTVASRSRTCMRMAADIVHDLGLDEDFLTSDPWGQGVTEEELEKIRAYLAYVYLVSTYVAVWKGDKCVHTRVPPWAGTAIDILEQNAQVDGDRTLAALVRLSRLCYDATDAINERENQTVRNSQLILVGIEQQYQQLRNSMLAACPTLFAKTSLSAKVVRFPPPVSKIQSGVKKIRAYLDYISELDDNSILSFTINDWTRLITALTLAFRLSFPLSQCLELNWEWANSEIQLDQFLSKVSREADATIASNGVLSANRAVLGVLKSKYNRRLSSLSEQPVYPTSRTFGCPMMSGGTIIAESQWNAGFDHASEPSTDSDMPEIIPMFPDVWATMAAGLQDIEEISWDSFDGQFVNSVGTDSSWSL
ncbi:hypothetical protein TrVFT333_010828 [Trichoderma virens FT-333]|nr:hypothetical protein TrVFT333_010828 [Trichoderma virens FT-333]